jgi:hypothetical protein
MGLGSLEVQIFVSLAVILGTALIALIVDFLKGNNENLREHNVELRARQDERERLMPPWLWWQSLDKSSAAAQEQAAATRAIGVRVHQPARVERPAAAVAQRAKASRVEAPAAAESPVETVSVSVAQPPRTAVSFQRASAPENGDGRGARPAETVARAPKVSATQVPEAAPMPEAPTAPADLLSQVIAVTEPAAPRAADSKPAGAPAPESPVPVAAQAAAESETGPEVPPWAETLALSGPEPEPAAEPIILVLEAGNIEAPGVSARLSAPAETVAAPEIAHAPLAGCPPISALEWNAPVAKAGVVPLLAEPPAGSLPAVCGAEAAEVFSGAGFEAELAPAETEPDSELEPAWEPAAPAGLAPMAFPIEAVRSYGAQAAEVFPETEAWPADKAAAAAWGGVFEHALSFPGVAQIQEASSPAAFDTGCSPREDRPVDEWSLQRWADPVSLPEPAPALPAAGSGHGPELDQALEAFPPWAVAASCQVTPRVVEMPLHHPLRAYLEVTGTPEAPAPVLPVEAQREVAASSGDRLPAFSSPVHFDADFCAEALLAAPLAPVFDEIEPAAETVLPELALSGAGEIPHPASAGPLQAETTEPWALPPADQFQAAFYAEFLSRPEQPVVGERASSRDHQVVPEPPEAAPVSAEPEPGPVPAPEPMFRVLEFPTGLHRPEVLHRLLEESGVINGVVVAVGINDYQQLQLSHGKNGFEDLDHSVVELIKSIAGSKGFAVRRAVDEFLLVFPNDSGPFAQRRLTQLSERLWDFQLRSLGTFSILFSWGAVEVIAEPLSEAVASANERMYQTKRSRISAIDSQGSRKRAVNL